MSDSSVDPRQHLAELKARLVAGDPSVTAAAWQKVATAAEFAEVQAAAATVRAEAEAEAQRQAEEDRFRTELTVAARSLRTVQSTFAAAVDALRALKDEVE